MKLSPRIALCTLIPFTLCGLAEADESDPFADKPTAEEQQTKPNEFEITGTFKLVPLVGGNPKSIPTEDWPKIENPITFNSSFDRPFKIWRVDSGYFGAFDSGEWGGALFFATEKLPKWTRIIDTHIQDLERFEGDTFLATGGLAHLSLSAGQTYLITRLPNGEWISRMVFSSNIGIPRIIGTSVIEDNPNTKPKKLIILSLKHHLDEESFFGADSTGAIHYLKIRTKKIPSEQDATRIR